MIKLISLIKRKKGMPVDEFNTYLLSTHQSLIAKLPGVQRYTYNLITNTTRGNSSSDCVLEMWFANKEDMDKAFNNPIAEELLGEEPDFLDVNQLTTYLVEEHEYE